MKDGYLETVPGEISEEELALINKQSRRRLSAEEVFTFSVVLCDNDIDRDFERFTPEALEKLAELYTGKTGIFDHSMKGRDQLARIYACEVETVPGRSTADGGEYKRLKARAYMPKTSRNEDLRTEIDAGIKKEVSVGCSVGSVTCSICGRDMRGGGCTHVKGRSYRAEGKKSLCFAVLDDPTDAFEWSFVAVPAQVGAGVVKSCRAVRKGGDKVDTEKTVKSLAAPDEDGLLLDRSEAEALYAHIKHLEKMAEAGEAYMSELRAEVIKVCAVAKPELGREVMEGLCGRMTAAELKAFKSAFEADVDKLFPPAPQIGRADAGSEKKAYSEFRI